jgi:hypothetical protein
MSASHSQVFQDLFVLYVTKFKVAGKFLEIGAGDGFTINNTLLLESLLAWRGIGVELEPSLASLFNSRRNNICITADATSLDYTSTLDEFELPSRIDYLQIDIDPAHQSLLALRQVLKTNRRFTVITFEHDLYVNEENALLKAQAFELLTESGYKRVMNNVKYDGCAFEDWYIDPQIVKVWSIKFFKIFLYFGLLDIKVRSIQRRKPQV